MAMAVMTEVWAVDMGLEVSVIVARLNTSVLDTANAKKI